ncbi:MULTISPECIES: GntR family transcriptional regulator [unclassified Mesorhizobium]|uniref:GntR family transcriptional regulator n=1 Tax=unclassified Mesorhizobium TaxID=325217 RepID=UPI001127317B|nr:MULTISPECIES: GntR family transcriptional regulator [unclassified Mesorhizobium]MBZ9739855.1 GntR family transcriptional regulator [Mesorhizobium sp. CO1-1-4]MBZ9805666.1 GntR family transcriptional regulator [Mesorhizobium sp. ES1-6]TPL88636.1 GntR family transcriptional regulator [Mesorhizobium sp. B2-3-12]
MLMNASDATISDTAYRQIRADIIFGRLVPGEKLKLERLKGLYGASVSTLREILNRLASDGLVVAEGQRGFEVAPVSPEDLKEIAALRQLLECHAMELSFGAGDVEWEGKVVSAHHKLHQMEIRMIGGDRSVTKDWKRYDWEFHQSLISACGSRALMETHAAVFDKYLRYQMISLTFRGQIAADEHRQLLEAALARDVATAQMVLRRHVEAGVKHGLTA